jgi:tRNA dimethylallyltransferase
LESFLHVTRCYNQGMINIKSQKLLVICGPTATGKTALGVSITQKFPGEIISADSRQVYLGMDILTGKDLPENPKSKFQISNINTVNKNFKVGYRVKDGTPIWLLDIVEPEYIFNVGEYRMLALTVIKDIHARRLLPIIVGGTGLYIKSITTDLSSIDIPPNPELREELEGLDREELISRLKLLDVNKWATMNQSDRVNPRRLIRAIEIAEYKNRINRIQQKKSFPEFNTLKIGLTTSKDYLFKRIDKRVDERMKSGVLDEVKKIMQMKLPVTNPSLTSTGYRHLRDYIKGKISLKEAIDLWKKDEHAYAGRQLTWFKKDTAVRWFNISEKNIFMKIEDIVISWYTSK